MRIIVRIETGALDHRGRDLRLCIADALDGATAWFRATAGNKLEGHRQPLRNLRPGVVPEYYGAIEIEEGPEL